MRVAVQCDDTLYIMSRQEATLMDEAGTLPASVASEVFVCLVVFRCLLEPDREPFWLSTRLGGGT